MVFKTWKASSVELSIDNISQKPLQSLFEKTGVDERNRCVEKEDNSRSEVQLP